MLSRQQEVKYAKEMILDKRHTTYAELLKFIYTPTLNIVTEDMIEDKENYKICFTWFMQ